MSKLKTLEEHNAERRDVERFLYNSRGVANGIACPECGAGLRDTNPLETLTSYPAQKATHCPKCNYTGYRLA